MCDDILNLERLIVGLGYVPLMSAHRDGPCVDCHTNTFDTVSCCQHILLVKLEANEEEIIVAGLKMLWFPI